VFTAHLAAGALDGVTLGWIGHPRQLLVEVGQFRGQLVGLDGRGVELFSCDETCSTRLCCTDR
jgi:hypothetical protein